MTQEAEVHQLVDHLFRHQAGRMTAALTRALGPRYLDWIEELVHDALVQALKRWPYRGIPEDPAAWLLTVARNRAMDRFRRLGTHRDHERALIDWIERKHGGQSPRSSPLFESEIEDDLLRMMFMCCHPEVPRESQIALTLKTVSGFAVEEIADAFLTKKETIAQRIVRAKRKIRDLGLSLELPGPEVLVERLDAVLEVLYLLFNEGYSSRRQDSPIRKDMCEEAVRLARLLAEHPATGLPKAHALTALLLMQGSRLAARLRGGELILLADQDRSLWNNAWLRQGLAHLSRSLSGEEMSAYHVQAAISALHAAAPRPEDTDWEEILRQYDLLETIEPSPICKLNRAVAVCHVHGPRQALRELEPIADHPALRSYYLLPATLAEFHSRCGRLDEAARHYQRALSMECSGAERRFLKGRLCTVDREASSNDVPIAKLKRHERLYDGRKRKTP